MAIYDDEFRELAYELLQDTKSITYTQVIVGEYNIETGSIDLTTIDKQIKGMFSAVSVGDITSGIATATDIKITIAALDIENPKNNDVIDNKYTVIYAKPKYSGDLIAYFDLICKSS